MNYLALATPETAICVITLVSYTVLKVGREKAGPASTDSTTSWAPR